MERKGFRTIAFPALGTGKLGYPYIPVAKTMMECVNDFGKQHPETCIQTVYIVVHDQDIHCLQVTSKVFQLLASILQFLFDVCNSILILNKIFKEVQNKLCLLWLNTTYTLPELFY